MSEEQKLKPLAERMRPNRLEDYIGQKHLLGEGKVLRKLLEKNNIPSIILWGPPGVGKTTLARLLAVYIKAEFHQISAVSSGVREVKEIIKIGKENIAKNIRTILFIDEIHRFNKSQQDALLHSVEAGDIILIGATTENPSFEVISALLSRTVIYTLKPLTIEELKTILNRALNEDEILKNYKFEFEDIDYLIYMSGGDARVLLNGLETIYELSNKENNVIFVSNQLISEAFQKKKIIYDKAGEEHYNIISAFIKSLRGSDPDAAVYWLARMIASGEDPLFIARRMIIFASEDIGNASPNALLLAVNTFQAVQYIGMPESRIILSQCATYLASAPKSNASYLAIDQALSDVENLPMFSVPLHLRNAPTQLMKELKYGKNYKYPHDYPNHFVIENYLPEEISNRIYYNPTDIGQEKSIKERLTFLWGNKKNYK